MGKSILGHRVLRREDPVMLTTGGSYVDDLAPADAVFVTYVRSTMAHARILGIDLTDTWSMPGVVAIVTGADLDIGPLRPNPPTNPDMTRPLLADGVVRFVGEPVAAILTETAGQGPDAAETIIVDYEPLPPLVDPEVSLSGGDASGATTVLFPEVGTNLSMVLESRQEPIDFDACEVVVSQRIVNQRVAPCPIEPRSATALWTADGRLVQYISCQGAHPIRDQLASLYGLDATDVRVVCPDVGGGFGAKADPYPEGLLLGWLARRAGRPVRWMDTRTENMVGMGHGRGQIQDVTIGGSRNGRVTHYRLSVIQDAGAYPAMGSVLPWMTRTMVSGVYDISTVEFTARSVVTTTTPTTAYRGAGRPEATAAIERAVDLFAAEIGMDPAEVRRQNFIPADAFPYTTATRTTYDSGDYEAALDLVLSAAGYDDLRAEQARRRAADEPTVIGIGLSTYVEITALGGGGEYGSVELLADGSARVTTGSTPYGQGHHTAWSMLVSERTGLPLDRIEVVHGDTDIVPTGSITGGSRSVQIAGSAVHDATAKLVDLARRRAADLLEAAPSDIVLDTDGPDGPAFHVVGTPSISIGWDAIAATDPDETLLGLSDFVAEGPTFPFGAHVAVVEVDTETGLVTLLRLIAVDDAGVILNPLLAEGQVHGGLAQGAAQALLEAVRFDVDGNPLTANFADYTVISAAELPAFERVVMETPTPLNELGAKGIGESGTIGSTPAVHNAVIDALSHLGVRHLDMPTTPERVWSAIAATRP